jgi:hypothetical protein
MPFPSGTACPDGDSASPARVEIESEWAPDREHEKVARDEPG